MAATVKSSARVFGGILQRMTHQSAVCKCEMTFAVYLPAQSEAAAVHSLYWLSGLTCTDENFAQKGGGFRAAAARGLALVMPDTSPRGVTIEGADDAYDFGSGAGFYVDATEPKWKENYQMYSYVTKELPAVLAATFPDQLSGKASISGHSMGGHGALTLLAFGLGLGLDREPVRPLALTLNSNPSPNSNPNPNPNPNQVRSRSSSRTLACTRRPRPSPPSAAPRAARGAPRLSRATSARSRRGGRTTRSSSSTASPAATAWSCSMVKVPAWLCSASPPAPPQGAPGGSGQLGTFMKRPAH